MGCHLGGLGSPLILQRVTGALPHGVLCVTGVGSGQAPGHKQFFQKVFTCTMLPKVPLGKASHMTKHRVTVEGYCQRAWGQGEKELEVNFATYCSSLGEGE